MRILLTGFWLFIAFCCGRSFAEDKKEKPKEAFVKIFNACYRSGVEKWKTGLDLKFHDATLANDVRAGEAGLVRQVTFLEKDTVDVYRCEEFADKKRSPPDSPASPAAKCQTSFEARSITLLLVYGRLSADQESIEIDAVKEFPVPAESVRPGLARVLFINARPGDSVALKVGKEAPFSLSYKERRELFLTPGDLEMLLSYTGKNNQLKEQMAALKSMPDCSYTAIIYPAAELPDRPSIRFSDSNEDWAGISSPHNEQPP
ncbi:MAG: hypothetical protein NTV93_18585 [Verrucomicrobia bacterium]|nr:hypothetical protein [Verrucomicrobiota bacterium]